MLKIRRSRNHLIFNMGIPIPGKEGLHIETGPWFLRDAPMACCGGFGTMLHHNQWQSVLIINLYILPAHRAVETQRTIYKIILLINTVFVPRSVVRHFLLKTKHGFVSYSTCFPSHENEVKTSVFTMENHTMVKQLQTAGAYAIDILYHKSYAHSLWFVVCCCVLISNFTYI